jgi:hypothetical protein
MFRINGNPDLPMVQIGSVAPVDKEVTIISMGRDRIGDLVDFGGGYEGYCTTGVRTKRWGRNMTSGYTTSQSSSFGRTRALRTYFDADGLGYDECQAVANDSGASLFEEVSTGNWALAGMALSVGVPPGYQGPSVVYNAVYTNCTYYADLSVYRSQIDTIRLLPLPGDADWDGDVDNIDIDILFATFGQIGSGLQADFNHDDAVNLEDFSILREYFGMVSGGQVPGAEELPLRMVPEPASLILIVGCLPVLLRRRRNRG